MSEIHNQLQNQYVNIYYYKSLVSRVANIFIHKARKIGNICKWFWGENMLQNCWKTIYKDYNL